MAPVSDSEGTGSQTDSGQELPAAVQRQLHERGLRGYNEVHDVNAEEPVFAGELADGDGYRFVDTRPAGTCSPPSSTEERTDRQTLFGGAWKAL